MLRKMAVGIGLSRSFDTFLNSKGAEYKPFDPSRFRDIYAAINKNFQKPLKVIQIVGTNGKGSTASFVSQMIQLAGHNVGVFSSPHLFRFNERIMLNSQEITDDDLLVEHLKLLAILGDKMAEEISFFEYSALIAYSFLSSRCDYLILEAGLGGEFDATTVFPKDLLLVTKIDIDHSELLGDTIAEIAKTKLKAMSCDTILSTDLQIVFDIATKLAKKKKYKVLSIDEMLTSDERELCFAQCRACYFADFLAENMCLALAGFKHLGFSPNQKYMPLHKPRGRFERILPNVTIDVGHNPACAKAIKDELNNKKVQLVFNSMRDKDYRSSLMILRDNISMVEIIDMNGDRIVDRHELEDFLHQNGFDFCSFDTIEDTKEYLVFGSFVVAQKFIEKMKL